MKKIQFLSFNKERIPIAHNYEDHGLDKDDLEI
jgi:hypothetical protein